MALLVSLREVGKAYSARPLFDGLNLEVYESERLALVGPNGAGKSTLLRILTGAEPSDSGVRSVARGITIAHLTQEDRFNANERLLDAVMATAVGETHEREFAAEVALVEAGFADPHALIGTLSGGWRKRLAIVRECVRQPQLMVMDEPTNHLDVEGVWWLEELLAQASFAMVVASHDRWFLDRVATRVVEIDPRHAGGAFSAAGGYRDFLRHRETHLAGQAARQETLANQVRREEEWLRKQPKARTTKSVARIEEAGRMQAELRDVSTRNAMGRAADIDFHATNRRSNDLVVMKGVTKALGGRTLMRDLDLELSPGTRLGLLGRNGSGKSTLLKLITGALNVDAGTIKRAQELRVVVFHQDRDSLDKRRTLRLSLCPNGDTVKYRDSSIHVMAWAKRFCFRPDQLDQPVGSLSGGEQARILISLLMLQPADLLILDEPTNDLDVPTLEVLEESLIEFPGAVALVTHDRFLLERVSTKLLALDGAGGWAAVPEVASWERAQRAAARPATAAPIRAKGPDTYAGLSKPERRELERMDEKIQAADQAVAEAQSAVDVAAADADRLASAWARLTTAQDAVERLYTRWAELEAKAKAGAN